MKNNSTEKIQKAYEFALEIGNTKLAEYHKNMLRPENRIDSLLRSIAESEEIIRMHTKHIEKCNKEIQTLKSQ